MSDEQRGLYGKYVVTKRYGPTDPNAEYIVLRIDKDPNARMAVAFYAGLIVTRNPHLSMGLRHRLERLTNGDAALLKAIFEDDAPEGPDFGGEDFPYSDEVNPPETDWLDPEFFQGAPDSLTPPGEYVGDTGEPEDGPPVHGDDFYYQSPADPGDAGNLNDIPF